MHRRTLLGPLLGLALLAACSSDAAPPVGPVAPAARPSLAPTTTVGGRYLVLMKGMSLAAGFGARVRALGGTVEYTHAGAGFAVVSGLSPDGTASLRGSSDVARVDADVEVSPGPARPTAVPDVELAGASPADPTTAAAFQKQWDMRAIGAHLAWAAGHLGSPSVRVAILDSGIDYLYPDLNGLVDLSRSVSFVPTDDALVASLFPTRLPITDLNWHGTHIASTVASHSNLVAGVTARTTLMAVKVLDRHKSGFISNFLRGVLFAADHDADVLNMSLGGTASKSQFAGYAHYVNRIFNYGYRRGVVIVVGAGNDALDLDHSADLYVDYCDAPNVICVSATGPAAGGLSGPWTDVDAFASYSNFGRSGITVAAPGGTVTGAGVLGACSQTSLDVANCDTGPKLLSAWGTSMATPHVSGLAALVVDQIGHGKPALVRARILQSADDLGLPGADPYYGSGRINVARALGL